MKNLKMFAIGIAAMAAMTTSAHAAGIVSCDEALVKADGKCYDTIINALSDTDVKDGSTITLLDDLDMNTATITINKELTIDLNGNDITFKNTTNHMVVTKDGKLTLKGAGVVSNISTSTVDLIEVQTGGSFTTTGSVELESAHAAKTAVIGVKGGADNKLATTVTIGGETTVTSAGYGLVLYQSGTAGTVGLSATIDINGTWDTAGYAVKANGGIAYTSKNASVININGGTITSDETALYASGYVTWNIKGGDITGATAIQANAGTVNIQNGTFTAVKPAYTSKIGSANSDGNVVSAISKAANYPDVKYLTLNITGGTFSTSVEGRYALYIERANAAKFSIGCATFTSGKDNKGKQLPAILVADDGEDFIKTHEGMITGGTYTGSVIGDVVISSSTAYTAEKALSVLSKDAVKSEADGKVTIGTACGASDTPSTQDPEPTPGTDVNPGSDAETQKPADESNVPKTGDSIMTFMGLGLASIAVVGLGTKNLKKQTN